VGDGGSARARALVIVRDLGFGDRGKHSPHATWVCMTQIAWAFAHRVVHHLQAVDRATSKLGHEFCAT
jgi:hypothetical protein